jgi:hypothetical protein
VSEQAKRCDFCGGELSFCDEGMASDGPSLGCLVCQLREKLSDSHIPPAECIMLGGYEYVRRDSILLDALRKELQKYGERNNELLAKLSASQTCTNKWQAALRKYGQHRSQCRQPLGELCTCGFPLLPLEK